MIESPTIKDIQQKRTEVEAGILKLLREFELYSSTGVQSVGVSKTWVTQRPQSLVIAVKLEVFL